MTTETKFERMTAYSQIVVLDRKENEDGRTIVKVREYNADKSYTEYLCPVTRIECEDGGVFEGIMTAKRRYFSNCINDEKYDLGSKEQIEFLTAKMETMDAPIKEFTMEVIDILTASRNAYNLVKVITTNH